MGKILLFYKYVSIEYPVQVQKWQRALCEQLGLKGRIILAQEGINGTVGGSEAACQAYKKAMEEHPYFAGIDFKESPGCADDFPRLRIVVKDEIVHLGLDTKKYNAQNGGVHLDPAQVHELVANNKNLVLLDCRNKCESDVGTFVNALKPNTKYFREFPDYVDSNLDEFKDKEVLMFCTGGIRCERASAYLKTKKVAKKVYQIKGGIHRYIEQYPDGFFRGKNYVFDNRLVVKANDDILGSCLFCAKECDDYTNCFNAQCNKHYICCSSCLTLYQNTCSKECQKLVQEKKVTIRTKPLKSTDEVSTKHSS